MTARKKAEAPLGGSPAPTGSSFWSDLLVATLPAAVLFLVLPVELYLPNQGEFDYKLIVLLPYPILLALWVLAWAAVFCFLHPSRRAAMAVGLMWAGLFLLLSDIVAPVQLRVLDGTQQQPDEPLGLTMREIALAATILLAAWKTPALWARQFGLGFAALLLVFQPIRFWHGVSPAGSFNKYDAKFEPHPPPSATSSKPNLYHIIWDSYSSYAFERSLQQEGLAEEFDGFIFFKENRSNYVFTEPSVASYMTGTFYKGGRIVEWIRRRFRMDVGITDELHQQGFEVWNYVYSHYYAERRASHAATNLGMMAEANPLSLVAHFADLWLLRAVPNFLQDEVYFDGKGGLSRLAPALEPLLLERSPTVLGELASRPFYSVRLARRLIQDEKLRPAHGQYVYAHIYLPHRPYVLNENCEYAPQPGASLRTLYYRQNECATKLMIDFIRELKRLGRYEQSAIILHADHATWEYGPEDVRGYGAGLRNADRIQDNLERRTPAEIDHGIRSLLLVKPPGRAGVPLEVSQRPTQLVDLAETVYEMQDIAPRVAPEEGQSVLSTDFPHDREIPVFLGYMQIDKNGRAIILDTDSRSGELNHFSYTSSVGWRRYPNLPVNK